jgi:hypothetical protein
VAGQVLKPGNGQKVKNLRHLVEFLRDSTEDFLTFHFIVEGADFLGFRRKEMHKGTAQVLKDAGIAPGRRRSKDLLAVGNPGRPARSAKAKRLPCYFFCTRRSRAATSAQRYSLFMGPFLWARAISPCRSPAARGVSAAW